MNGKKILEMNPGERVAYSWDENTCFTDHVDVNVCAVWRFNQLVFENTTLREIANQLSIKYNVNVNIESSRLAQRRFLVIVTRLCFRALLAPIPIEQVQIYISNLKSATIIQYTIKGRFMSR
ncbi:MAG: FecR domain-containing protein [Parabacteroides merdae]